MILPFCGMLIMIIMFIAPRHKLGLKMRARGLAIESLLVEWNAKCFGPARYCLKSGHLTAYFVLTNLDLAPENMVNIVPVGPVMGGYPGIPSGYAPGQLQSVGQ
jgi:hypothetical protein